MRSYSVNLRKYRNFNEINMTRNTRLFFVFWKRKWRKDWLVTHSSLTMLYKYNSVMKTHWITVSLSIFHYIWPRTNNLEIDTTKYFPQTRYVYWKADFSNFIVVQLLSVCYSFMILFRVEIRGEEDRMEMYKLQIQQNKVFGKWMSYDTFGC